MKPATALPWVRDATIADCTIIKSPSDAWVASFPWDSKDWGTKQESQAAKDCAYAVHACNHYPELVAALRECAAMNLALIKAHWVEDHGQRDVGEAWGACERAQELLAKLGEQ